MNQKEALQQALVRFGRSLHQILDSVSYAREESERLLGIFNGELGTGQTVKCYQQMFPMCFEEAVLQVDAFTEGIETQLGLPFTYPSEPTQSVDLTKTLQHALNDALESLLTIEQITSANTMLYTALCADTTEDNAYNPFARGIRSFVDHFRTWCNTYLREIAA